MPDGVRVSARHAMFARGFVKERDIANGAGSSALRRMPTGDRPAVQCAVLTPSGSLVRRTVCHGKVQSAILLQETVRGSRRTFDRWLQANAIFGSIFGAALIAMAFAGSRSIAPRDAAVASGTTTGYEVGAPEQRRTRTEGVTTYPKRSNNVRTIRPSFGHPFSPTADLPPDGKTHVDVAAAAKSRAIVTP